MQWERHKTAKNKLQEITEKYDSYRIIHYSCQSFKRVDEGRSARITSIAIYSCNSDTTTSFDIQSISESLAISYESIDKNLDRIEKELLSRFYKYTSQNQGAKYLHWNMRDSQFGFQALANRYSFLTGKIPEFQISDDNQINLAKLLEDYYGLNYVDDPKMKSIVDLNPEIRPKYMLTGSEEADAFDHGHYNDLNKSTLSKVRLFNNILKLVSDKKLKVSISWIKSFGVSPQILFEKVKDTWWWAILTFIIGIILGSLITL